LDLGSNLIDWFQELKELGTQRRKVRKATMQTRLPHLSTEGSGRFIGRNFY